MAYDKQCASCHGKVAEGNIAVNAPPLGGQDAAYLRRQITNFRTGKRIALTPDAPAATMVAIAAAQNDEVEIQAITGYLATLRSKTEKQLLPAPSDLVAEGRPIYAICVGCHSARGEGNPVMAAPRIAALPRAYITTQLQAFRSGGRGSHPDDKYGRQMVSIVNSLGEDVALDAIAAYLASLGNP